MSQTLPQVAGMGDDLSFLVDHLLARWPAHARYLQKSFEDRPADVMATSERVAGLIRASMGHVPGGLDALCDDYRFLCEEIVPPEELFFRRHGHYRLTRFADADAEVYQDRAFMTRYMNGLLMSDIMWIPHACAIHYFHATYLPSLAPGSDHLEIGPGHGLFLFLATESPNLASAAGWDVSPASIASTRAALGAFGARLPVTLSLQNLFDAPEGEEGGQFDSIVMSEILEHLEDPVAAVRAAARWLRPGGRLWVNVPANSPAPDHLFLVTSPEHACDLVREAGLEVEASAAFPMTGATLDKARRQQLSISCLVTGRRAS